MLQIKEWLDGYSNNDNIMVQKGNMRYEIVGVKLDGDTIYLLTDIPEKPTQEELENQDEVARLMREKRAIERAIEGKRQKREYHRRTDAERAALGLPPAKKKGRPTGMTKEKIEERKKEERKAQREANKRNKELND